MGKQQKAFVSETREGDYYVSTYKHSNSLYEDVKNLTVDDFQMVIPLAASALNHLNQSVNTIQYKEMIGIEVKRQTVFFEADKQRLENDKTLALKKKEKEFETTLAPLNNRIEHLAKENSQLLSQMDISNFYKKHLQESYNTLKKEVAEASSISLGQQEVQHKEELCRLREILESQAKERVAQCDTQHREAIDSMRKLYEVQATKDRKEVEKTLGSSTKGKQGEKLFADIVAQHTNWEKMQDVSKTSHSTDMRCNIRNCQALFEIKNYNEDIPVKEVAKFERDMEENQDCPLGVFISLNTNIVSKKSGNFITSSWSPKSQLLIYVNSFYEHPIEDIMVFIDMCADFAWKVFKSVRDTPEESDIANKLQDRIEQAKIYIEKDIKCLAALIMKINHNKKFLVDSITKHTADYVGDIQQRKYSLQCMLELFLGRSEKPEKHEDCVKGSVSTVSAVGGVAEETDEKMGETPKRGRGRPRVASIKS